MERNISTETIVLSDGSEALVQVNSNDTKERQVSRTDEKFDIKDLQTSIKSLINDIIEPFSEIKLDKVTLEMGLNIGVKSGKITSLLINGNLNAAIKVIVEWKKD